MGGSSSSVIETVSRVGSSTSPGTFGYPIQTNTHSAVSTITAENQPIHTLLNKDSLIMSFLMQNPELWK